MVVLSGDPGKYAKEFPAKRKFDPMIFCSREELKQSIQRIIETADIIIPGHDRRLRVMDRGFVAWEENAKLELKSVICATPLEVKNDR